MGDSGDTLGGSGRSFKDGWIGERDGLIGDDVDDVLRADMTPEGARSNGDRKERSGAD